VRADEPVENLPAGQWQVLSVFLDDGEHLIQES
jgi:hypothetical protein